MSKKNKEERRITIKCNFAENVRDLFQFFSTQLSDGYWEGDEYYESIWNCFEFESERSKSHFIIVLKNKPTWNEFEENLKKFQKMSGEEIADYLKDAIINSINDYPFVFTYGEYELDVLEHCIYNWEILPPPLPKLTHKELVEIVGYNFEYVKE